MEFINKRAGGNMLKDIQEQHQKWQKRNFGEIPPEDSLIGIMEELGELSHSFLKQKQGVRFNEDHNKNMRDAIGDIVIFLISFCSSKGWDFEEVVFLVWQEVKRRDWIKYPRNGRAE
jgi:NTP pyrophosphatase (non-canonical NTP hydrolase)